MEAVKRVSTRAEQLSGVYQMGNVRAEYRDLLLWKGLAMAAFLPIGLVFLALIFSALIPPSSAPQGDWLQRLGQDSNLLPLLPWCAGFLLLGLPSEKQGEQCPAGDLRLVLYRTHYRGQTLFHDRGPRSSYRARDDGLPLACCS
jgi:hypothetical protein